jgi:hypothetical protein
VSRWFRQANRVTKRMAVSPTRVALAPRGWPAFFPYVGFTAGYFASPGEAAIEFYGTAAQIIPVLLLVLAVEFRFFRFRGPGGSLVAAARPREGDTVEEYAERLERAVLRTARTIVALGTLALLIVGEFVALHPVAHESAEAGHPRWVYGAIGAGFGALAALAVLGEEAARGD